jgi:hypothetical protein
MIRKAAVKRAAPTRKQRPQPAAPPNVDKLLNLAARIKAGELDSFAFVAVTADGRFDCTFDLGRLHGATAVGVLRAFGAVLEQEAARAMFGAIVKAES